MRTERQRLEMKQWRDELAAEEDAARIERERPVKEAEALFKQNVVALGKLQRQRILTGKDEDFKVDLALANARMSIEAAQRYNSEQAALFVQSTPDYYPCEANQEALTDYLFRNGIQIASAVAFKTAYERLHEYGLLEEEPDPEPEPAPSPIQLESQPVQHKPETFDGWDVNTQTPRIYTKFEVDRMDSATYRLAFHLARINRPGEQLI